MSRLLAGLLALALLLGPPMAQPADTAGSDRFCYNWDFLNSTDVDATGLLARFRGIKAIGQVYAGPGNLFGEPQPGGGYDQRSDTYTLTFAGGPAYTGDLVHIGFCTDAPTLRRPLAANTPALVWQAGGSRVQPDPIFVGASWSWVGATGMQVQLFNDGPANLTLMTATLYDPDQALDLDDLSATIVAGLSPIAELITETQALPAGGTLSLSAGVGAVGSNHPVVLEIVVAADDDPGNTAHLYIQTLTPWGSYLPLILR